MWDFLSVISGQPIGGRGAIGLSFGLGPVSCNCDLGLCLSDMVLV